MQKKRCHFRKKLEIISELKKGKSQRLVSTEHDKSTVADIWKGREKIEACFN